VSHRFPLTSRLHRSRTAAEDRSRGPKPSTAARASCGFRPGFRTRNPPQVSPSLARAPHPLLFRGSLLRQTKQTKQASQKQRVATPPDRDAFHRHLSAEQELVDRADALAGRVLRSPDPGPPTLRTVISTIAASPPTGRSRRSPCFSQTPRSAEDKRRPAAPCAAGLRNLQTTCPVRRSPRLRRYFRNSRRITFLSEQSIE
jgi:hypothetical protein